MEKKKMNRRNFLGGSLAAAAAVTVGSSFADAPGIKSVSIKKSDKNPFNERTYGSMPTNSFGKT